MYRIALAVLCTFIEPPIEATSTTNSVQGLPLRVENSVLKEQIHDNTAYIAAITDRQHSKFTDRLKSSGNLHLKTEDAVMNVIAQHMINVTKSILPDLKELIKMTDNREQSAFEVNRHFAEDHVEPMLLAIFGEDKKNHPTFYDSLRKRIAEAAQSFIRLIFKHHLKHVKVLKP